MKLFIATLIAATTLVATGLSAPFPISAPGDPAEAALLGLDVGIVTNTDSGNGLIVGRAEGKLLVVTAGHVVGGNPKTIAVTRFRKPSADSATIVVPPTDRNVDDLAVLEIPDDPTVSFAAFCAAPAASSQAQMPVWFYGHNWSGSTPGSLLPLTDRPVLQASGFDTVVNQDSGGPVLGQPGLIGLLSSFSKGDTRELKLVISFVTVAHVQDLLKTALGPDAWKIPECAPRPIFVPDPVACEATRDTACWLNAALDAFRAAPRNLDADTRVLLARGIGRFKGDGELAALLTAAPPEEHPLLLLDAAATSDKALAHDWLERGVTLAKALDDSKRGFELRAKAVGVAIHLGDRATADSLAAELLPVPAGWTEGERALALMQLAYYSTDVTDHPIVPALSDALTTLLQALPIDTGRKVSSALVDWVDHAAYTDAPTVSSAIALKRLRWLAVLPPLNPPGGRDAVFHDYVDRVVNDLVGAYADLGDFSIAPAVAHTEAQWWFAGNDYWQTIGLTRAEDSLVSNHLYDAARQLLLTGLSYSDTRDEGQPELRYAGNSYDDFYKLAVRAAEDEKYSRLADADFDFAYNFANTHVFSGERENLLPFFIEGAGTLCKQGRAAIAAKYYVGALEVVATQIATNAVLSTPFFANPGVFDLEKDMRGSTFALSDGLALSLGVELPSCIATAYALGGNDTAAQALIDIAKNTLGETKLYYDQTQATAIKASFSARPPDVQAAFLGFYLPDLAGQLFSQVNQEQGKIVLGEALLHQGQIAEAKAQMADDVWTNISTGRDELNAMLRAFVRNGQLTEARALFDAHSLKDEFSGVRSADAAFDLALADINIDIGNFAGAADTASRLSASDNLRGVRHDLLKRLFDRSADAAAFESALAAFASFKWSDDEEMMLDIVWDYIALDDGTRSRELLTRFISQHPDASEFAYNPFGWIADIARNHRDEVGMAGMIKVATLATRQTRTLLLLAGVR